MQFDAAYISRVAQIDALILDKEFNNFIKNELIKILNKLQVSQWCEIYAAEFDLILSSIIWKFTLGRSSCTIGQRLLGLKYEGSWRKLYVLYGFKILGAYLYRKLTTYVAKVEDLRLSRTLKMMDALLGFAEVGNFCLFLIQNKYPSLDHRWSRLRMVPAAKRVPYAPGDSYQIRELLWHQFSDFLMIAVPFLNLYIVRKHWASFKQGWTRSKNEMPVTIVSENMETNIVLKCCHCHQDAIIPQHVKKCCFCYFCMKANDFDSITFECSLTGH